MRAVHNKILRVDLTTGSLTVEERNDHYYRHYLGGWNLVADTLLREVPRGADPLGPENRLIFSAGIMAGMALSGASRTAVGAKSPLTGGFGVGETGGNFGAELKRAGFDAIIIHGRSDKPVYLWIKDGVAEIRDASRLWGLATKETQEAIAEELGDRRVQCAMIGPAGEHMVKYACVMNGTKDAAGRSGLGAVMGSKNLKAVAARGTMSITGADEDKIRAMSRAMAEDIREGRKAAHMAQWGTGADQVGMILTGNLPTRNFRDGDFDPEQARELSSMDFMPKYGLGMEGCWACSVRCKKVVKFEGKYNVDPEYGGPEYETLGSIGSCCGVGDIAAVALGSQLCNAYGLDVIGAGVNIALAMEAYENGLLTSEQTGGLELKFGDGDMMIQLLTKIAMRDGIGDLLAEGTAVMAERIGGDAWRYAMAVKNQAFPAHEPRFKRALGIGFAVSPTGADHMHSLHDAGLQNADANGFLPNGTLRGLGVLEPVALESLGPDKVRAHTYNTIDRAAQNCMLLCNFVPWTIAERVELINAATGWDVTAVELFEVGERALNLARVFNLREGLTAADDRLPERSYGPTRNGALADGGLDREDFQEAVQLYYGMMGWDEETGKPGRGTLERLGIGWAAQHLP
ncbi:MAG: aldehyde ferredoxin oxidoreductase family protein [Anaerolineae bacterium]